MPRRRLQREVEALSDAPFSASSTRVQGVRDRLRRSEWPWRTRRGQIVDRLRGCRQRRVDAEACTGWSSRSSRHSQSVGRLTTSLQ